MIRRTPRYDYALLILTYLVTQSPVTASLMRSLTSLSFAILLATATAANGADLLEIYRLAQTADAQYAAARAAWSAGQEKLPQGLSGLLPSATVSASSQYNDREIRSRDPATGTTTSQFNSNAASISVTQPLYRPQNFTAYDQAKSQVVQADAVFAQAAQDLHPARRAGLFRRAAGAGHDRVRASAARLRSAGNWSRPSATSRWALPRLPTLTKRSPATISRCPSKSRPRTTWKSGNAFSS